MKHFAIKQTKPTQAGWLGKMLEREALEPRKQTHEVPEFATVWHTL